MEDFYLNDEKRKFYDDALAHVRNCDDDFWNLDEALDKHVDVINTNSHVRTMYSRKGRNRLGPGLESYLTICFTKNVEEKIKDEIEVDLKNSFSDKPNCTIVVYHEPPRVEVDDDEAAPYLKYIVDPEYWNVHHIKFEIKGGNSAEHDMFWTILSRKLSEM
jgi:hypothetical protein